MLESTVFSQRLRDKSDLIAAPSLTLNHPDDVLHNRSMSTAEKRAIFAGWFSDADAVPNMPTMRRRDSGAIVSIDTVLAALHALDAAQGAAHKNQGERGCLANSRRTLLSRWRRSWRRRDHDDDRDPPPCPSTALPPRIELELRRRRDTAWGWLAA